MIPKALSREKQIVNLIKFMGFQPSPMMTNELWLELEKEIKKLLN